MRTIKDPKKKPDVRRRTDLDEEQDDVRSTKSTPPKKRKTAKAKDESSSSLNDSGSFADNQSDIVSERSSVIGEDDASDVSSLKSTPPKKRSYHKLGNKAPEVNGDLNTESEEPEKKLKTRKPPKKEEKSIPVNDDGKKEDDKKVVTGRKSPKGRKKALKPDDLPANDTKSTKASNESEKVTAKAKKSPASKKSDQKSKAEADASAGDAEMAQKTVAKRKRRLSGPATEEQTTKDKKLKAKKDKPENESNENNATPPKPKPKAEKKSKKQTLKEQAQLELKRQTEEQRNSHSEKSGINPDSVEPESKEDEPPILPPTCKSTTPKKKIVKNLEKSNVVNHVLNSKDTEPTAMDNAIKSIEEVSKADYVLSIPDNLRSEDELADDEDDHSSDLDTSFESINSERSKCESVCEKKLNVSDSFNSEFKEDEPSDGVKDKNQDEAVALNSSLDGKTEINIKCEACGYISKSKGGHTRHLRKCQPAKFGLEGSGDRKLIKMHKCEQCDYSAPRRVLVINHMKVHGIFQCKRCTYRTDCEENLDDHSGHEHKDRSDCKFCKLCNRYVKCSEVPLEKHMEECQGRVPFKCPECSKEFQYESSLKCHVVSHYPDQPKLFSCDQCDYKSNYKANLKKHVRHIHEQRGEKSIKCPQCDKCFHTEDNMRRHQKLHSTERPHKCDQEECDKAFKTFNGLKLHMISHQTERPFACEVEGCTKGFKTNFALGKHINEVHQNAPKTFKCPEENCTMAFYKKFHLERHVEAHKDNRSSFFCTWPTCTKAFKTEDIMKTHLLVHTDEKPLKCDHCDYVCRQKSSIRFHIKKKHADLLPPSDLKSPKPLKKGSSSKTDDTPMASEPASHPPQAEHDIMENGKGIEHSDDSPESPDDIVDHQTLESADSKVAEKELKDSGDNGNISSEQNSVSHQKHSKDFLIQNQLSSCVRENKENVPSNLLEDRTSVLNQTKPEAVPRAESAGVSSGVGVGAAVPRAESAGVSSGVRAGAAETPVKKPKKTDMYEFQSEEESGDEMKPGLLRKEYDKDKPPLPPVTSTKIDPSLLSSLDLPPQEEEEEGQASEEDKKKEKDVKKDVKEKKEPKKKEPKPPKVKKKPGPKPKPKPEKQDKSEKQEKPEKQEKQEKSEKPEKPVKLEKYIKPEKPVKTEKPEPEPEVKQPKRRGRKKKSEIEKERLEKEKLEKEKLEKEKEKKVENEKADTKATKPSTPKGKGKRGRSPKAKKEVEKDKETSANEEEDPAPVLKKKRGPKKKVKEVKEEPVVEKVPKKRGRKKKVVKEDETKKEIEPENGDATINYSEVESSEMFADSKDSVSDQTPDILQVKSVEDSVKPDTIDEEEEKENVGFNLDAELKEENENKEEIENKIDDNENDNDENNAEKTAEVEDNENAEDNKDDNADDKKSSDLDSDSSDIGSDFDEDLKPPPAPRPPPMYDSEDGDIESGPENEDFNGSALSNEPLRDFESSRDERSKDISRDFESSRELNDSVKTNEVHSVETSTPKDLEGTPSSVNILRNDSVGNDYDNQETPYPQSHHSSVSHTPSHNSIPPTPATSQEFESHGIDNQVGDRMIKTTVQGQTNDENTDESSMPEVDKDYVGRFFEEIQCTQTQSEGQINRMNSIEESSKSQEKVVETSQSDSGVPSSLTSNQTDSSMQMQSPPTDLSMKRMDILSSDRPPDDYQPRSVGSDHRSSDQRIPSVPSFEAQYNPLDPYSSTLPPRDTILRQTEKAQSPTNPTSFMRFPPESEAVLQRQRMTTPYDRNIQNLHRIAEPSIPQHNSSSPLLRHVTGREDMFPTAAGVGGSMSRNPFHSSWSGQDVRPAHWGHPTYLQRPLDQQSSSTSSSLFGKDSYLPGREFMFDPSRAAAERNMSFLASSHSQRPDIPHDTFQFDRFDLGTYLSSHGYNAAPSLPVDYTRSAAGSTQKSLDERYRQSSSGVSDYRSLPQTSSSDMFTMNSSFNLDKFYPRDAMYHSQHITDNTNSRFLPGVAAAAQHSMFGRDYAHPSFYAQNTPYPFVNMNDKNYSAATAKLAHTGSAVGQQRELVPVPRPNMSAPDPQLQDPYRHHSSMLYNMMNRYFD